MRQAGREATAIDLPADDPNKGLDDEADIVIREIGTRPNVVLIAQSLGGVTSLCAAMTPFAG